MQFLELLKFGDNWILTSVIWSAVILIAFLIIKNFERISKFIGEVKGELRKASWPWESDPKIKGFKKYKELVDSTIVVLIAMILLAGFVQLWDFIHIAVVSLVTGLAR